MSDTQTNVAPGSGPLSQFPPARWMVLVSAGLIAALYLGGLSSRWEPTPDSALYLSLARSLDEGQGYQYNGEPNNTVTPGLPWVLWGLRKLGGEGMFLPNLFVVLCALGAAALIYKCIAIWSDRRTALAVTIAWSASWAVFYNAHCVLTDSPFALVFWALIYCCLRAREGSPLWLLPAAALSAAGIVLRAPGALLIGPLAVGLLLDRGKASRRLATGAAAMLPAVATGLIFLCVARHIATETPKYLQGSVGNFWASNRLGQLARGVGWELPNASSELFTSQDGVWMLPVGIAVVVLMTIGLAVLWKKGQRSIAAVLVSFPIVMTLLGGYQSVRPRYMIPVLPLLLYACIVGLCWVVGKFASRTTRTTRRNSEEHGQDVRATHGRDAHATHGRDARATSKAALIAVNVLVAVVVACNLPKDLNHAVMVHREDYYHRLHRGQHEDLMNLPALMGPGISPGEKVALQDGATSLFHYVTGKQVELLPYPNVLEPPPTAADADRNIALLRERTDLKYIILHVRSRDKGGSNAAFWDRLESQVRELEGVTVIYPTQEQKSRGFGKSLVVLHRP